MVFKDGSKDNVTALFARAGFKQHSGLPQEMGCKITEHGFLQVDEFQKTTVPGIYAAGDNAYGLRAVSIAAAAGTTAGGVINHELINETF